ncbi:MAG: hypothetical protein HZA50_06360 [Planctomycetes bacterium]|nr:hypothetical protein [Planctomycetota bacterium]
MKSLTGKERLKRAARRQEVDRIPSIGGWMNGVKNLAELAGICIDRYLADPPAGVVLANKALNVDGMVSPVVPTDVGQIRTGAVEESSFDSVEPEDIVKFADSLPDGEKEILADFDPATEERKFRDYFDNAFKNWRGIEPIPNFWHLGGHFPLYTQFGYVAFLSACALYPQAVGKIWRVRSVRSRESAKILARLYRQYDLVPLLFCGEDICNNQGPMVSPLMLREFYFPTVKMILAPLVEAGVRIVHHCDGDVRPVVGDFIDIGFSGLQGFQYELGLDPREFRRMKSARGEELIFFASMSVTRTLPFGEPQDVRDEVDYLIDCTDGGRGMFLFSSNVIGVEVPPANIRAGYEYIKTIDPARPRPNPRSAWPWKQSHPE